MAWYTFFYNCVTDKITEMHELQENNPVPSHFFDTIKLNGELEGYYLSLQRKDTNYWGKWNKKKREWEIPPDVPEVLKLTRILVE